MLDTDLLLLTPDLLPLPFLLFHIYVEPEWGEKTKTLIFFCMPPSYVDESISIKSSMNEFFQPGRKICVLM